MTSITVDRKDGLSSSTAVKGPCVAATTANILLTDEQTIDGVAVVAGDRVLVKTQTDAKENGIYVVSTGDWVRSRDFASARDVQSGTMVVVSGGATLAGQMAVVMTVNPVVIGTSNITLEMRPFIDQALALDLAEVASISTEIQAIITNMAAVQGAAGNALLAQAWASEDEDTPVAGGLYSALHYAAKASAALNQIKWTSRGIGEVYSVDSSIVGADIPPTDNPLFRYVLLTAGEDGSGEYNEGVVSGESVSGSYPDIDATFDIDFAISPIDGQTINLLNTEGRFMRPADTPGELLESSNKNHFHTGSAVAAGGHTTLVRASSVGGGGGNYSGSTILNVAYANIAAIPTPDHTHPLSINNQGNDEARPRSLGVAVYMRIS